MTADYRCRDCHVDVDLDDGLFLGRDGGLRIRVHALGGDKVLCRECGEKLLRRRGFDTEAAALAVTTRDWLRMTLGPSLLRAIALTGPPISDARAAELNRLLRSLHIYVCDLAALHLHTIKARRYRPRHTDNMPLWEGHLDGAGSGS